MDMTALTFTYAVGERPLIPVIVSTPAAIAMTRGMVDTGAVYTHLNPEIARELGYDLDSAPKMTGGFSGVAIELSMSMLPTAALFNVGGFTVPIMPTAHSGELLPWVLLGQDFLRHFVASFDARSATVTLTPHPETPSSEGARQDWKRADEWIAANTPNVRIIRRYLSVPT